MIQIDNIRPFNGVCVKISGGGCLLNITDEKDEKCQATLGITGKSPSITLTQYNLETGEPLGIPTLLSLSPSAKFSGQETTLPSKHDDIVKNDASQSQNSRLIGFCYYPNLSDLYHEKNLLGFDGELSLDWSFFSHQIKFEVDGEFCTYKLGMSVFPDQLEKMHFYNKTQPDLKCSFGYIGKDIGFITKFNDGKAFIYSDDKGNILYTIDYNSNVYTVIEIKSCLDPDLDPFNFYYDSAILYTPSGSSSPLPINGSGIYSRKKSDKKHPSEVRVYCTSIVLSANHP